MSLFNEMNSWFGREWYYKWTPSAIWRRLWGWTPLYWLRSHTFTKYHQLDLRTPEYRWGWIDRSEALVNANFNILKDFIELEKPFDHICYGDDKPEDCGHCRDAEAPAEGMTDEEKESIRESFDRRRAVKKELLELYEYWLHGKAADEKRYYDALHVWSDARKVECGGDWFETDENGVLNTNKESGEETNRLFAEVNSIMAENDQKLEDNLIRLIKLRKHLWT